MDLINLKFPEQPVMPQDIEDVLPCTIVVTGKGRLRTIVGSGISVCLYDKVNSIAGMNHFLLPRTNDPENATGRYGNAALYGLVMLLRQNGASFPLVAYMSGGAFCDEYELDSALENIGVAWNYLLIKKIPLISQFVGGQLQREVFFDVGTGFYMSRYLK
jgi:chemotaxis protein CheD